MNVIGTISCSKVCLNLYKFYLLKKFYISINSSSFGTEQFCFISVTKWMCYLVQPPTVHPINLVVEGSSMTILCIAMGTPMPTISLYISGRLVRQEVTRHMVTVIYNVTRDMDHISCYADNGYGTPMERRKKITISRQFTICFILLYICVQRW